MRRSSRSGLLILSVCLGLFLVSFGRALAAGQAQKPTAKPAGKPGAATVNVEAIYKQQCQACHGADGKGQLPGVSSFPDGVWEHGSREQDIVKVIRDGVPGTTMMGFRARLKPEEIEALARFVRSFDKKLKPEAAEAPARK